MGFGTPAQEKVQAHRPFRRLAPKQVLLTVGSADMKARVSPAHIKDVDKESVLFPHSWCYDKSTAALFRLGPTFRGEKLPFGTVYGEFASLLGVECTPFLSLHVETFSYP